MIALDSSISLKSAAGGQASGLQVPGDVLNRHPSYWLDALLSTFPRSCFTEIDQAFLVWGGLTLFIFSLGQFSSMSWMSQSILDAVLTGVSVVMTSGLTWAIACSAGLRWVIFLWAGLMTAGTVVTVCGIFCGSALVLSNLCLLWLGLCALGYGVMAVGMRSRCFTAACLVHLGALVWLLLASILSLSWASSGISNWALSWQFFSSGLVMALTLFFFSFVPWDMR